MLRNALDQQQHLFFLFLYSSGVQPTNFCTLLTTRSWGRSS